MIEQASKTHLVTFMDEVVLLATLGNGGVVLRSAPLVYSAVQPSFDLDLILCFPR